MLLGISQSLAALRNMTPLFFPYAVGSAIIYVIQLGRKTIVPAILL